MKMPIQAKPVLRTASIQKNDHGVTASGIACTLCMAGCSALSGMAQTLCQAACNATVC